MARESFAGKICLVTGAARGIGGAIARAFAEEGAQVVMTDVLGPELDDLASALGQTGVHHDVADEQGWRDLIKMVEDRFNKNSTRCTISHMKLIAHVQCLGNYYFQINSL